MGQIGERFKTDATYQKMIQEMNAAYKSKKAAAGK